MTTIDFVEQKPDPVDFLDLLETTGWNDVYKATVEDLRMALNHSWYTVTAYDAGQLVGFGRVVSDGVLYGVIYDMIVRPSHKGQGIGTEILNRLTAKCQAAGLRDIQLFSAKGKSAFYGHHGFVERPQDAPGMRYQVNSHG
jgi:GNAT superfamily N-acetyltransferase